MKPTFIEMFCGIGGFRLGLEKSGWRCIWANDLDKYACQVYRKNFGGGELIEGDIRKMDVKQIPDHTLLTAGFPCQAFSVAGKRQGFQDTRGTLFYDVARVAEAKKPPLLLLENVKGLLSSQRGYSFARILQTLDELGYDVEWQVLNSKHFGVPQNRERVFIIGHLRGTSSRQIFPIGEEPKMANRKNERQEKQISTCLDGNYWKGTDKHGQRTLIVDGHHKQITTKMGTLTGRENRRGTNWMIMFNLQNAARTGEWGDGTRKDGLSYPLTAHSGRDYGVMMRLGNIYHNLRIRRLTSVECERLQGFPDGWTEGVSDTQRYKLLGNAVTVNVVEFLGRRLKECIS